MPDTRVPGRRCGSPRYDCSSDGRQVPLAYQCDGQPDCPNGEDEINCSKFPRLWDPLQSHMYEDACPAKYVKFLTSQSELDVKFWPS